MEEEPSTDLADRRRRELLDAAYALIAEKGLEHLRTRDIAARAGVNISTLHYYFGTKDGLVAALIRDVHDQFKRNLGKTEPADDAGSILRHIFVNASQTFRAKPYLATVLQELLARAGHDTGARAALGEVVGDWRMAVEALLRAGIDAGAYRADLDPRAGALIVTAFIMGARTQHALDPGATDFEKAAAELECWLAPTARPDR